MLFEGIFGSTSLCTATPEEDSQWGECWWTSVGCVVPQVVPGPVCQCPPAVLFRRLLSRL